MPVAQSVTNIEINISGETDPEMIHHLKNIIWSRNMTKTPKRTPTKSLVQLLANHQDLIHRSRSKTIRGIQMTARARRKYTHSLTIDRICRHYKSTRCERENREKILPVLPVNVRCFRVIEVIKIYLAPSHSHYGPTQHLSLEAKPRNYTECHLFRKWMASLCQLSSQRRPYKVHPDREEASSLQTIVTFRDLHGPCFR